MDTTDPTTSQSIPRDLPQVTISPLPSSPSSLSIPTLKHPNDPRSFLPQAAQKRKVRELRRLEQPPEPELLHPEWIPREFREEIQAQRREKFQRKLKQRANAKRFLQGQLQELADRELQKKRQRELEEWVAQSGWEEKYAFEEMMEEKRQMEEEEKESELGEDEVQLHAELQMHVQEWEEHEMQSWLDQLEREEEERDIQRNLEELRKAIEEQQRHSKQKKRGGFWDLETGNFDRKLVEEGRSRKKRRCSCNVD
jgi:hypothetical protein